MRKIAIKIEAGFFSKLWQDLLGRRAGIWVITFPNDQLMEVYIDIFIKIKQTYLVKEARDVTGSIRNPALVARDIEVNFQVYAYTRGGITNTAFSTTLY